MFDAARHDDELAGSQGLDAVAELDAKAPLPHQEHFLGLGVAVPGEDPLHLDQPHVLPIQLRRDARPPVVGKAAELLLQIDDLAGHRGVSSSA
ncbi:hypothetical protein D3C80_1902750 [compost metagenome]